jgi:tRNA (cytidine/uridine-2'-O-)-methyltransferase
MPNIALLNPEIAGNVGSIIRSCACFGADLHIIEPCGFPFDMNRIKRSAMDYIEHVNIIRHNDFESFYDSVISNQQKRLILATTKAKTDYKATNYTDNDVIIFGTESGGFTEEFLDKVNLRVTIPMKNNMRSLNLAVSCAIILAFAS